MRLYLAADAEALRTLRAGGAVTLPSFVAASDDEEDEFAALSQAATAGAAVVIAELDRDDQPVALSDVEAIHVDADGSGDLAWYAAQEIDEVVALLP